MLLLPTTTTTLVLLSSSLGVVEASCASVVTFSERKLVAPASESEDGPEAPVSFATADLDSDLDIDVVVASREDDVVAWYANDDGNSFTRHVITATADGANSVAVADVDGDLDLDVVSSSGEDATVAWYANLDGLGNFSSRRVITTQLDVPRDVYTTDLDSDDDLDVVAGSREDGTVAWFENTGTTPWEPHVIATEGGAATSVFAADLDGDADVDVLSTDGEHNEVTWYEQNGKNGSSSFTRHVIATLVHPRSAKAADLDSDADLDVVVAGAWERSVVWYEGPTFTTRHLISTQADGAWWLAVADLDSDDDLDVVAALRDGGSIKWFQNNLDDDDGAPSFTEHLISDSVDEAYWVAAADLDGDFALDVLACSEEDDFVAWFPSTCPTPPPTDSPAPSTARPTARPTARQTVQPTARATARATAQLTAQPTSEPTPRPVLASAPSDGGSRRGSNDNSLALGLGVALGVVILFVGAMAAACGENFGRWCCRTWPTVRPTDSTRSPGSIESISRRPTPALTGSSRRQRSAPMNFSSRRPDPESSSRRPRRIRQTNDDYDYDADYDDDGF